MANSVPLLLERVNGKLHPEDAVRRVTNPVADTVLFLGRFRPNRGKNARSFPGMQIHKMLAASWICRHSFSGTACA